MRSAIFIGDELTAAGFRLAGVEIVVPEPNDAPAIFEDACRRAALVVMTAEMARHIPAPTLEAAQLAETPLLAIIPDVLQRVTPPDLTKKLRSVLGIET